MRVILVALFLLLIAGCERKAPEVVEASSPSVIRDPVALPDAAFLVEVARANHLAFAKGDDVSWRPSGITSVEKRRKPSSLDAEGLGRGSGSGAGIARATNERPTAARKTAPRFRGMLLPVNPMEDIGE